MNPPAHAPAGPRFFQIGFHRCGTTSLATFFNRCGIACVHNDKGRLALRMRENIARGARPLEGYEHYRAFADMVYIGAEDWYDGFRRFRELEVAYGSEAGGCRFILNTRPMDDWIRSVTAHAQRPGHRRRWAAHLRQRFGTSDAERIAARWRDFREAHHAVVRAELPRDRLLEFDIQSDPPQRLCSFVGVSPDCARHWRHENRSPGAVYRALAPLGRHPLARAVPRPLKRSIASALRDWR